MYAILSAAGFSLKAIFVKLGYAAAPVGALTLLTMRMGLALPLFVWLIWLSRRTSSRSALGARDLMHVVVLGALGYYLSSLFDFYGLESISAGLERLILYLYPTLVLVFHAVVIRRWPGMPVVQAMAVCYLGLGIAFVHDAGVAGQGAQLWTGAAWVFASAVTYALYYLGTGAMLRRVGSMRLAGLAGSASSVLVLAHFLLRGHPLQLFDLPPAVWLYAALMALVSTVLPVYWMAQAIERMGAAQAAAIGNLGPVLTLFASWGLLGETLSVYQIAGLALVLFGVSRLKPERSASDRSQAAGGGALAGLQAQSERRL
ncbi:DMT family transporter [Jeongeupia chitinilytica]|uniref:Permease n=1 Tax=Jeongeupia chitinilytica TaxID=1041641 RepID=A0ABQ3GZ07_9NEIS|nr:DMT family transporter [Jeongeupia chitinilytica]GHD58315.1 permease [Jeongeupia chitinilytica]